MAPALTRKCPVCGTEIQRTLDGTLADGMREHTETVHPITTKTGGKRR